MKRKHIVFLSVSIILFLIFNSNIHDELWQKLPINEKIYEFINPDFKDFTNWVRNGGSYKHEYHGKLLTYSKYINDDYKMPTEDIIEKYNGKKASDYELGSYRNVALMEAIKNNPNVEEIIWIDQKGRNSFGWCIYIVDNKGNAISFFKG